MNRRIAALLIAPLLVLPAACSSTGGSGSKEVVVATHSSWAAPEALIKQFETDTGYTVKIVENGDAGSLTNKLVLTKKSPIADVVYGIDNTFASRAVDEGILADYRSPGVATTYDLPGGAQQLTPVDWGDVCVNVDDAWFAKKKIPAPKTLDDLVEPQYKNLFVTPGAATSSPGFAFLLATIAKYGATGWKDYWHKLIGNGVKIDSGWDDAWNVDYTAGGGSGERPIVLSYNTSPVDTIPKGQTKPTTSALLDTCFRQVEYAGVLKGAEHPDAAKKFVDFLSSTAFQESLPDNMYVFPVDPAAKLPESWASYAPPATTPLTIAPADIAKNRQQWLSDWSDVTS